MEECFLDNFWKLGGCSHLTENNIRMWWKLEWNNKDDIGQKFCFDA